MYLLNLTTTEVYIYLYRPFSSVAMTKQTDFNYLMSKLW